MYKVSKRLVSERNEPGTINERFLFHGSDASSIDSICRFGFNRSYCGKNGIHGHLKNFSMLEIYFKY